jgi:glycosyltransferase involved in cell wall biosynthesis
MDYRILMPVATNPELVTQKLRDVPDLTKLVLVNNFDNPKVLEQCRIARDEGAEVYYYPENLGVATSWNIGLSKLEGNVDFVIFLSVSVVFERPLQHFIDFIMDAEMKEGNCRYVASSRAMMHCFAHTQLGLTLGGYFDENFWPAYYEDTDYCRRSLFNGVQERVVLCNLDDVVHSKASSLTMKEPRLLRLLQANAGRIHKYYLRKWGGEHLSEKYTRPFNNPNTDINEWIVESPFHNTLSNDPLWRLPQRPYRLWNNE